MLSSSMKINLAIHWVCLYLYSYYCFTFVRYCLFICNYKGKWGKMSQRWAKENALKPTLKLQTFTLPVNIETNMWYFIFDRIWKDRIVILTSWWDHSMRLCVVSSQQGPTQGTPACCKGFHPWIKCGSMTFLSGQFIQHELNLHFVISVCWISERSHHSLQGVILHK